MGTPFKMKGFSGFGNSPAKQLKPEYMRSPEEKAFYMTKESKDWEPIPSMGSKHAWSMRKDGPEMQKLGHDSNTDENNTTGSK